MREIRHVVDIAAILIRQSRFTRREAEHLVARVRQRVLTLFPDGEQTYEIIYVPRFRRLIEEFTLPEALEVFDVRGVLEPPH